MLTAKEALELSNQNQKFWLNEVLKNISDSINRSVSRGEKTADIVLSHDMHDALYDSGFFFGFKSGRNSMSFEKSRVCRKLFPRRSHRPFIFTY